jgi:hypothetical protein
MVGIVSWVLSSPKDVHCKGTKKNLRHVKGTLHYGLAYMRGDNFKLVGHIDLDWEVA